MGVGCRRCDRLGCGIAVSDLAKKSQRGLVESDSGDPSVASCEEPVRRHPSSGMPFLLLALAVFIGVWVTSQ
jgi:hypothetical protein